MAGRGDQARSGADEAALVQRSRGGDRHALAQLLERYDGEALNMAYRLVGHREDALDIRQQAYARVVQSLGGFDGRSSFRTWLGRIVVNLCRDHLRRRGAHRRRADGWSAQTSARTVHGDTDPALQCAAVDDGARVAQAVGQLPEAQREVLVLRHYHEMTLTAVAQLLEIPLSTAGSRLNAAMGQLRTALCGGAAPCDEEPCLCPDKGAD